VDRISRKSLGFGQRRVLVTGRVRHGGAETKEFDDVGVVPHHSMIAHLLGGLEEAVDRSAAPAELDRHLDGIAAIMESHFRYEERQLLSVLETLALDADPTAVLGPL
jgi:hypothetical protein